MQAPLVAWSHASLSAFLFRSFQKELVSEANLSVQTLHAMTLCSSLVFIQCLFFPVYDLLHFTWPSYEDPALAYETAGWAVDAALLLSCVRLIRQRQIGKKSAPNDKDIEDDFGKSHTLHVWFSVCGPQSPPPPYLHRYLVYFATSCLAFLAAWGQSSFSFFTLAAWALERPTAMIAIFVNLLRGIGLLPQLHYSRRIGHVASVVALWIALKGVVDIVEFGADLHDGIAWSDVCYFFGDGIAFLLVSDFLWLFIKTRAAGQAVVTIPTDSEV
jgi:hypothetical protein